jgi:hypothetical protein
MKFDINKTISIIERTPSVLYALLHGISDDWIYGNEGKNTWSPFDVMGHLIICERTNFFPRVEKIYHSASPPPLSPIDMTAHIETGRGKTITALLNEFDLLRKQNIQQLLALQLSPTDLEKTAIHPRIGEVTIAQLLATWTAHDLSHLSQITRVMTRQYKDAAGPFTTFITILRNNE